MKYVLEKRVMMMMIMKRDKSEKMNIMQRKKVWMVTCLGWARKG